MADIELQDINSSGELTEININGNVKADYLNLAPKGILGVQPQGTIGAWDETINRPGFCVTDSGDWESIAFLSDLGNYTFSDAELKYLTNTILTSSESGGSLISISLGTTDTALNIQPLTPKIQLRTSPIGTEGNALLSMDESSSSISLGFQNSVTPELATSLDITPERFLIRGLSIANIDAGGALSAVTKEWVESKVPDLGNFTFNASAQFIDGNLFLSAVGTTIQVNSVGTYDSVQINAGGELRILGLSIADIDAAANDSAVTKEWVESKVTGATGTFTSQDGKTITVTDGLITSIV